MPGARCRRHRGRCSRRWSVARDARGRPRRLGRPRPSRPAALRCRPRSEARASRREVARGAAAGAVAFAWPAGATPSRPSSVAPLGGLGSVSGGRLRRRAAPVHSRHGGTSCGLPPRLPRRRFRLGASPASGATGRRPPRGLARAQSARVSPRPVRSQSLRRPAIVRPFPPEPGQKVLLLVVARASTGRFEPKRPASCSGCRKPGSYET